MNPVEVSLIVVVTALMVAIALRRRWGINGSSQPPARESMENDRLRGQVQQLQDRLRVLERIVTDRGAETASQIEALREHDRIVEEDKA